MFRPGLERLIGIGALVAMVAIPVQAAGIGALQGSEATQSQLEREFSVNHFEAQSGDTDLDGLTDEFEDWAANTFVPVLYFSKDELAFKNNDPILRIYQVTPIYKTAPSVWNYPQYEFPEYQGPPGILITYVITYPYDYGEALTGIGMHAGDTETIRIFLVNPRNQPQTWDPFVILIKRHYDDPERYTSDEFGWSGTHPIVWVSENKHAMYSSWNECDDASKYLVQFEWCGSDYTINYPITLGVDGFNVGERLNKSNVSIWAYEQTWNDNDFCGGQEVAVGECGGGLDSKWWPNADAKKQAVLAIRLQSYTYWNYIQRWGAEYNICFSTGDVDRGGTDLHVDATLQGTTRSETFYDLDNGANNFERGNTDCFGAGTYELPEGLKGLSLYVYNDPDTDSEWFLNGISVQENFTGEFWQFPCNCWIDDSSEYDSDIGQSTYGPWVGLQPSP